MDLDRHTDAQPPDEAPADARGCVVATQPDTVDRCRNGIYPATVLSELADRAET
jgi:hypothetical protein